MVQRFSGLHDPNDGGIDEVKAISAYSLVRLCSFLGGLLHLHVGYSDATLVGRKCYVELEDVVLAHSASGLARFLRANFFICAIAIVLDEDSSAIATETETLEYTLSLATVVKARLEHNILDSKASFGLGVIVLFEVEASKDHRLA